MFTFQQYAINTAQAIVFLLWFAGGGSITGLVLASHASSTPQTRNESSGYQLIQEIARDRFNQTPRKWAATSRMTESDPSDLYRSQSEVSVVTAAKTWTLPLSETYDYSYSVQSVPVQYVIKDQRSPHPNNGAFMKHNIDVAYNNDSGVSSHDLGAYSPQVKPEPFLPKLFPKFPSSGDGYDPPSEVKDEDDDIPKYVSNPKDEDTKYGEKFPYPRPLIPPFYPPPKDIYSKGPVVKPLGPWAPPPPDVPMKEPEMKTSGLSSKAQLFIAPFLLLAAVSAIVIPYYSLLYGNFISRRSAGTPLINKLTPVLNNLLRAMDKFGDLKELDNK